MNVDAFKLVLLEQCTSIMKTPGNLTGRRICYSSASIGPHDAYSSGQHRAVLHLVLPIIIAESFDDAPEEG